MASAHSSPHPADSPVPGRPRLPPGPRGLPLIGNLFLVDLSLWNDLGTFAKTYGPIFSLRFGSRPIVVLTSADALHEVCAQKGASCAARPHFLNTDVISGGGRSILYSNGDAWRVSRRLVGKALLSPGLLPKLASLVNEELCLVVKGLHAAIDGAGERRAVTLSIYEDLLRNARFNLMARLLTGTSLAHDEATFAPLRAAAEAEANNFGPQLADFVPILKPLAYLRRLRPLAGHVHRFCGYFVAEIRRRMTSEKESGPGALGLLLRERARALAEGESAEIDAHANDMSLAHMLYNLMGTTNPTHITVMRSLWMLLCHPEALIRAEEEVLRVVGPLRAPSFEDQEQLTYLGACIEETLRMHPPTPSLVPRLATEDIVTKEGYLIPQGTIILANIAEAGLDRDVFPLPHVFRPERFLVEGNDAEAESREQLAYHSMPFGLGPRACPARKLGLMIVRMWLAHLLQGFKLALVDPPASGTASPGLSTATIFNNLPQDFRVRFSPRATLPT